MHIRVSNKKGILESRVMVITPGVLSVVLEDVCKWPPLTNKRPSSPHFVCLGNYYLEELGM